MTPENYKEFLITRLVTFNAYDTVEALLEAIAKANALSPETDWRQRKDAFNRIGEMAPLQPNPCYALTHADIPHFLEEEVVAFKVAKQMRRCANARGRADATR